MRDRIPGTPKNITDNYLCVVCFPASAAAANPAWVRSLNKAMDHLVSEGNPPLRSEAGLMEAVLACNTVLVTNLASLRALTSWAIWVFPGCLHMLGIGHRFGKWTARGRSLWCQTTSLVNESASRIQEYSSICSSKSMTPNSSG